MISHYKVRVKPLAAASKCRCMLPMLFRDPLSHELPIRDH